MSRLRGKRRRALSCLLLLLLTFGVTTEAVHSHGSVAPHHSGVAAISDGGGSDSDTNDSHHRECVICQLQQQLFNDIVHAPLFIVAPSIDIEFVSTLTILYSSSPNTRPSGRAPPLARG
jgi:hypothetical protein